MPLAAHAPIEAHPGAAARIAALADQCVKCGLCQPHCPTYRIAGHEAESPRGRIALSAALAGGALDGAGHASAARHIDQCLACLRCERVCPSQVRYAELLVSTRALLRSTAGQPRRNWIERWLARPLRLRAALCIANWPVVRHALQSRWLAAAWRRLGLWRALRELPRVPREPVLPPLQHATPLRGTVGLFIGCVAAAADRDVHAAARRLLQALGYAVAEPRAAGCCGALALHRGDLAAAQALAAPTRRALLAAGVDTVLVSASGCFGTLRDHVLADAGVRVREIHEFLAADARFAELKFRALARRVALHTPCTQASVARAGDAIVRVLRHIPQLDIVALPDAPGCCGAAGDYWLRHAHIADALRAQTLDQAGALAPDLLATSNVGCRVWLDNGLRGRATPLEVIHPVALLARQLDN